MAKKTHLINAFEGGQNSSADPRDISRNESISIKNLNTNRFGKLVMSGKFVEHEATLGTLAGSGGQEENKINTSFTGTGLFHFSSDYNILDGSGEYLTTDPTGESDIFLYTILQQIVQLLIKLILFFKKQQQEHWIGLLLMEMQILL